MKYFKDLLYAVSFLTIARIEDKRGSGDSETKLKDSIKFFPVAGLLIGGFLSLVFFVFNRFLGNPASVLLSFLALFIVTGGMHFDGLSDTADGLFAYLKTSDRKRFYGAMKDVNTGFAGNAAIMFYILVMWIIVSGTVYPSDYLVLIVFPVIGRYSIVVMSYFLNTPDDFKGIGTIFTEGTGLADLLTASAVTLVVAVLFLKLAGFFALLITVFSVLVAGLLFSGTFGGVNGDMLGFGLMLSEVVFMISLSGFLRIIA